MILFLSQTLSDRVQVTSSEKDFAEFRRPTFQGSSALIEYHFVSDLSFCQSSSKMGGDGGSIPNRYDLVDMYSKFEKRAQPVDKVDAEQPKWYEDV